MPGGKGYPRSGWRLNEELEAQNALLLEGLRAVTAGRTELENRHNALSEQLNAASDNVSLSERSHREIEARLRAEVISAQRFAGDNQTLEARVAELSSELSLTSLEVADREHRALTLEAEAHEQQRLARDAAQLAAAERQTYQRDLADVTRRAGRLRRQLAKARWGCVANALALSRSRRLLSSDEARAELKRAIVGAHVAADGEGAADGSAAGTASAAISLWTLELWMRDLPLSRMVSAAVRRRLGARSSAARELGFLANLAGDGGGVNGLDAANERASATLEEVLRESGVLADISRAIAEHAAELSRAQRHIARTARRPRAPPVPGAPAAGSPSEPSSEPAAEDFSTRSQQASKAGVASSAPEALPSEPAMGKFADAGPAAGVGFALHFGGLRDFLGGLTPLVGPAAASDGISRWHLTPAVTMAAVT